MIALLLGPPAIACLLAIVMPRREGLVSRAGVALAAVPVAAAILLCAGVIRTGIPYVAAGGFWRVDAWSALIALCIASVCFVASAFGPGFNADDHGARRYRALVNAFALTMLAAVTTNNVGIMWVAIEATTI